MLPCDGNAVCAEALLPDASLERLLRVLAVATMLMTVPQVIAIWVRDDASGVSVLSWMSYLISSVAWLVYGLRKGDRTIWATCIGWIVLDVAIIAGIMGKA